MENQFLNFESYTKLVEQLNAFHELKGQVSDLEKKVDFLENQLSDEKQKSEKLIEALNRFKGSGRFFCRKCKNQTFHVILDEKSIPERIDDDGYSITFRINQQLQCLGCQTITNKDYECDSDNNPLEKPNFSPDSKRWHLNPKETIINNLDNEILKKIYQEAIECFNKEMEIPCSVTLRTLIEGIGVSLGIKDELVLEGRNVYNIGIEKMVERMVSKGIITRNIASILAELRLLGNESTHSLIRHPREELQLAILIVENIIENIYTIPKVSDLLKNISDTRRSSTRR